MVLYLRMWSVTIKCKVCLTDVTDEYYISSYFAYLIRLKLSIYLCTCANRDDE